jgi:hypothetical protein
MPPKKENALTPEQVGKLRAWVDAGAPWPVALASAGQTKKADHWAFQPPVRPAIPEGAASAIEAFVTARLRQEKLEPSPEADRATLLRRLSLDLTGLPPTPQEIDAFTADQSADAYQTQVDRLLASSRYGERWARWWLDAARYADSDGFEKDLPRQQWAWRDWVIDAFNRDLPWDRFIVDQIAGDLLPNATVSDKVATGFIRNSMVNEEGAIVPEQFRMEAMFDRMDAIGKGVLGLTIQCAQCHTHKFDPITHEEYFKLFAFLNNAHEGTAHVYAPPQLMEIERITREMTALESGIKERVADWQERLAAWEKENSSELPWTVVRPDSLVEKTGLVHPELLADGSVLCLGHKIPMPGTVVSTTDVPADKKLTGLRLEALTHGDLPFGGPGRSYRGLFAISELKVEISVPGEPDKWTAVKLQNATADFAQPESPIDAEFKDGEDKRTLGPAAFLVDGKDETAWGTDRGPGRRNRDLKAVVQFAQPLATVPGSRMRVTMEFKHSGQSNFARRSNGVGRFRLSVTDAANPVADPLPRTARLALAKPRDQRSAQEQAEVFNHWRATTADLAMETAKLEELWKQWPETAQTVLVAYERPPELMRETKMLQRGEWDKPSRPVEPGVPAFLHPLPENAPRNRLTFAKWLVDRNSPTAARVVVNRVWQSYFGTGLVETPEDFGTRCDLPSHPELLDWLAVEFMESGWSLKKLHSLIVSSATYRQSSKVTPTLLERDPTNRLLARGPRFRVEAEMVRDIALSVGGLLHEKIGGPSIFPPVPEGLLSLSYIPVDFWKTAEGQERFRRSLYVFRRRSMPDPVMSAFDAPAGDTSCVRRAQSNTPLAALVSLNEPVFIEAAQALAGRTLREGGPTDESRAAYAFRLCTGRAPRPDEISEIVKLTTFARQRVADGWLSARQVATGDPAKAPNVPPGLNPAQAAAWTVAARVLLNLDETLTKN